jgi:hypothetical protein
MQMRVDLLERTGTSGGFSKVSASGLGVWRASAPGVTIYRYVRQVTNLPAPGDFRATFSYRWLDAQGSVQRTASRMTPICVQPDERPSLAVGGVTVTPSASALDAQYSIVVRNSGRGPAGPFGVALTVNGASQAPVVVQSLGAGQRTVLPIVAPRCTPGSSIVVTLDPQGTVSEAPGGGLPKTVDCPQRAAAGGGS